MQFTTDHMSADRSGFRTDIQALRGIAVLAVVLYHARENLLPGGFIGVDVFFVISGYLITQQLVRNLQRPETYRITTFYARRVKRLLPALALLLTFVLLAHPFFGPLSGLPATRNTGILSALSSANLYLIYVGDGGYFGATAEFNSLLHTWSLSVEEQFYLFYPAFALVCWRWLAAAQTNDVRLRRFGQAIAAMTTISFLASVLLSFPEFTSVEDHSTLRSIAFYSPVTRAWQFGVGALLVVAWPLRLTRVLLTSRWFARGAVTTLLIAALTMSSSTPFPGLAAIVPTFATALLLVSGEARDRTSIPLLRARILTWLGGISYGWYLWHWPMIVFSRSLWPANPVAPLLAGALAIAPAVASLRYVETPIRKRDTLRPLLVCALVAASVLGPVAGRLAADRYSADVLAEPAITQLGPHLDSVLGCDSPEPLQSRQKPQCQLNGDQSGSATLIGDSNAGHFSEAVAGAAEQHEVPLQLVTFSGCPFIDLELSRFGVVDKKCGSFVSGSISQLTRDTPSVLLIANASDYYINDDRFTFRGNDGRVAATPATKAALWQRH